MPIIDHSHAPEVAWRPNYRRWDLAGPPQGVNCTLATSLLEVGAGAPLHSHEADELIVVLEGALQVRLGEETHTVQANQTIVIPANTPHGFTSIGPGRARTLSFYPVPDPFAHTTYLEGIPPEVFRDRQTTNKTP